MKARKKNVCVLVLATMILFGVTGCGKKKDPLDDLIVCLIRYFVLQVPLAECLNPPPPVCSPDCWRGEPVVLSDGSCYWEHNSNSTRCGKNVEIDQVDPDTGLVVAVSLCQECGTGTTQLIGFDAIPPSSTIPKVTSITPQPGKILDPKQAVLIEFKQTMDAASVALSSDIAAESSPYAFSRSADQFLFNDTLTVAPATSWSAGRRTLQVDLRDDSGNPSRVKASWFVPAPGQAIAPDFSTCTTLCGQRWFLPYGVSFDASGGFPPYVWSIPDGGAPPHDEAVFAATGLFAGGPSFCFLCDYTFTVCVTDQAQSQTCHVAHWNSGL
jgi:hypothetical protein